MANSEQLKVALPDSWASVPLPDVLSVQYGKGLTESQRDEAGSVPVYGSNGIVGYHTEPLVAQPSVVIGRKGAAGEVHYSDEPSWTIDTAYYAVPRAGIHLKYAYYYLKSANLGGLDKSTAIPSLSRDDLYALSIPIPPLLEQHRIVAAIEAQFIRLDAAVAALERAQANLARYKASVLQAACEGRLVPTEAELAEAEGRDYEPADVLLTRILEERRARWEEERWADLVERAKKKAAKAERKAAGLPYYIRNLEDEDWQDVPEAAYAPYLPKGDRSKAKYRAPAPPDTERLPELPEGWVWVSVEHVSSRIVDCLHSTPSFQDAGRMCVDTNAMEPGRLAQERIRYVDEETFEERNRRMKPEAGDVLFSREGALLGVAVELPPDLEICLGQRVMIFRLAGGTSPTYFEAVLNSTTFSSQYRPLVTGTASPHLNIRDIRTLAIPLPPMREQQRIAAEAEAHMSLADELRRTLSTNLARADRLRQSILKRAFEGRLVTQEQDDGAASTPQAPPAEELR